MVLINCITILLIYTTFGGGGRSPDSGVRVSGVFDQQGLRLVLQVLLLQEAVVDGYVVLQTVPRWILLLPVIM